MASSTPRSGPPDIVRAPVVSAVVADPGAGAPVPRPEGAWRMPALPKPAGPYRRAWWRLRRDRMAVVSGLLLAVFAVVAYLVPLVITIDPYQQSLRDSLLPPGTPGHVLGTDNFGRDVLL